MRFKALRTFRGSATPDNDETRAQHAEAEKAHASQGIPFEGIVLKGGVYRVDDATAHRWEGYEDIQRHPEDVKDETPEIPEESSSSSSSSSESSGAEKSKESSASAQG